MWRGRTTPCIQKLRFRVPGNAARRRQSPLPYPFPHLILGTSASLPPPHPISSENTLSMSSKRRQMHTKTILSENSISGAPASAGNRPRPQKLVGDIWVLWMGVEAKERCPGGSTTLHIRNLRFGIPGNAVRRRPDVTPAQGRHPYPFSRNLRCQRLTPSGARGIPCKQKKVNFWITCQRRHGMWHLLGG